MIDQASTCSTQVQGAFGARGVSRRPPSRSWSGVNFKQDGWGWKTADPWGVGGGRAALRTSVTAVAGFLGTTRGAGHPRVALTAPLSPRRPSLVAAVTTSTSETTFLPSPCVRARREQPRHSGLPQTTKPHPMPDVTRTPACVPSFPPRSPHWISAGPPTRSRVEK